MSLNALLRADHPAAQDLCVDFCPGAMAVPAADVLAAAVPRVGEPPDGVGFVGLFKAFSATGGTLDGSSVDRLVQACHGDQATSLSRWLASGQVFGFEWNDTLWVPMFQFDPGDLSVRPGSQQLREELPVLWSGWTQACWLATPNARLLGQRPVDVIDSALDDAILAARAWRPAPSQGMRAWAAAAKPPHNQ